MLKLTKRINKVTILANGEIKMNCILEKSSNQTNNLSWKDMYDVALANGILLEQLLDQLEDELRIVECSLMYYREDIDRIDVLEQHAKAQIHYEERQNYLNTLITIRNGLQHRK